MNLTNVIVPKVSIGGIAIGESITQVQARLSDKYKTHNSPGQREGDHDSKSHKPKAH